MGIGAFYGSLAASASVFIGISSAYLVNKLVSSEREYNRLSRQLERKKKELEQYNALVNKYEKRIADFEKKWNREDIEEFHNLVDGFIADHINQREFCQPPEKTEFDDILDEVKKYTNLEQDIDKDFIEVLAERVDDIESELAEVATSAFVESIVDNTGTIKGIDRNYTDVVEAYKRAHDISNLRKESMEKLEEKYADEIGFSLAPIAPTIGEMSMASTPDPSLVAASTEIQENRRMAEENQYSRLRVQREEAKTRASRYEKEINVLEDEVSSIDSTPIKQALKANIIGIILSVVVPSINYYLIEINFQDPLSIPTWLEAFIVSLCWICGLGYIMYRFSRQVEDVTRSIS